MTQCILEGITGWKRRDLLSEWPEQSFWNVMLYLDDQIETHGWGSY